MTNPVDPSSLGDMLSEAMSALDRFQTQPGVADSPRGVGEAADGMITVSVVQPGRIDRLRFDPRVMRLASETLAEEITAAVNAALTDLQTQVGANAGRVDLSGLGDQLRRIQDNAERQLAAFTSSMIDAQERLTRKGEG